MKCSPERIEGAGKTITKLWNVARFVSMFGTGSKSDHLMALDEWIINETNTLIDYCRDHYEKYDFHNPAARIKNFLWETFASHYLELVKNRAYNEHEKFTKSEQNSALFALNYCLDSLLKMLAPIIPFVTHKIYMDLHGKVIGEFPQALNVRLFTEFSKEELMELNSAIWKAKKDKGLSLKAEIAEASIPDSFKIIEKDFMITHGIKKISYGKFELKA